MNTFEITIKMDNAAFGEHPEYEAARILRKLSDQIELMGFDLDEIPLMDLNGNKVGSAFLNE